MLQRLTAVVEAYIGARNRLNLTVLAFRREVGLKGNSIRARTMAKQSCMTSQIHYMNKEYVVSNALADHAAYLSSIHCQEE